MTSSTIKTPHPAILIDQCLPPRGSTSEDDDRVLLYFGAVWCSACRRQEMKSILSADLGVGDGRELKAAIYVSCDLDEEATTAFQVG